MCAIKNGYPFIRLCLIKRLINKLTNTVCKQKGIFLMYTIAGLPYGQEKSGNQENDKSQEKSAKSF